MKRKIFLLLEYAFEDDNYVFITTGKTQRRNQKYRVGIQKQYSLHFG